MVSGRTNQRSRRSALAALAASVALAGCGPRIVHNYGSTPPAEGWAKPFVIGVFDPDGVHVGNPAINTEHLFMGTQWVTRAPGFFKDLAAIDARGHDAIVTLEPWPYEGEQVNVLEKVLAGGYDKEIGMVIDALAALEHDSFFRWAHEPEIPVERYPWQLQEPALYIEAFRYVARMVHARSPRTRMVFGPTGDKGLRNYYPGDEAVDVISLCIYGLPDKDIDDPNQQESFSTIVQRKLDRVSIFEKPVLVAEFGVMGTEEYKLPWVLEAADALNVRPRIIGASYFNRVDVDGAWGGIAPPQWAIQPATFAAYLERLKRR